MFPDEASVFLDAITGFPNDIIESSDEETRSPDEFYCISRFATGPTNAISESTTHETGSRMI